jgi:dTDP-4-amino-4,6-dideoxygalactose transaminase
MAALSRLIGTLTPRRRFTRDLSSAHLLGDDVLEALRRVLSLSSLSEQMRYVGRFDREFASVMGARHAKSVSSGTAALYFALRALDIGPGDEVITVANTWISTITAIRETGASCRFIDIDPRSGCMDPEVLAAAIGEHTRAVLPVHMYGNPVDLSRLLAIAARFRIHVIEDACQAIGARLNGKCIGTWGTIGCYSFHTNKLVGAPTDGGMLVTDSADLIGRIRSLTEPNWDTALSNLQQRIPSRLAPLAVPILQVKLRSLDEVIRHRAAQLLRYRSAFADLPETWMLEPGPGGAAAPRSGILVSRESEAILAKLRLGGFELGPAYRQSAALLEQLQRDGISLPNTRLVVRQQILLPLGPSVSIDTLDSIIARVRAAF